MPPWLRSAVQAERRPVAGSGTNSASPPTMIAASRQSSTTGNEDKQTTTQDAVGAKKELPLAETEPSSSASPSAPAEQPVSIRNKDFIPFKDDLDDDD